MISVALTTLEDTVAAATPITCRPADLLEDKLPEYEKAISSYKKQDEDVLTYALFPSVALDYFKYREAQDTGVDTKSADSENKAMVTKGLFGFQDLQHASEISGTFGMNCITRLRLVVAV